MYWMSLGTEAGVGDRRAHDADGAVAGGLGGGDVMGVGAHAVAHHLGVDPRAARDRRVHLLEHQDAGAFREHEAVAPAVPGT